MDRGDAVIELVFGVAGLCPSKNHAVQEVGDKIRVTLESGDCIELPAFNAMFPYSEWRAEVLSIIEDRRRLLWRKLSGDPFAA